MNLKTIKKTCLLPLACTLLFLQTPAPVSAAALSSPMMAQDSVIVGDTEDKVTSPTEGIINATFVEEAAMKDDLLQMLAHFMTYVKADFQACAAPNSAGEECGCFKGEATMANNEKGVRPNADLSMICAFLYKYGQGRVTLPAGVAWDDIKDMALKSLVFAYSTHKANQLKVCSGGNYWGSTSASDYTWESSLWAMSVAYSAFFQYDRLSDSQKQYVYNLIKAECNYELARSVPTGYAGDTKAEENGWETNILSCALGLYPSDALAPQWFARLRQFAVNCYSQIDDAVDATVVDPDFDNTTVKELYKGKNLYDDYTLQNHNLFHTSYQNVVMQELGESFLALKMFQQGLYGSETWKTQALMHNNQKVMDRVLNQLALADGELAMPNGNDWSLFLYDQITSYTTMACFLRDANALMLENLAYKNIKARQTTTTDGSWLLRPDVGARRMGVEAHRVMMTWLMHEAASTATLTPTAWSDFSAAREDAHLFESQNIVRAATSSRFTCFSWSTGIGSYTGYFTQNAPDKNKIVVPYRANNTGNLLGWYTVSGKGTNATPVVAGIYNLKGNSYTMNGVLSCNDGSLTHNFALYSTPGNALIYLDCVVAASDVTLTGERGGLLAVSTDDFTKLQRTLYHAGGRYQTNGSSLTAWETDWANIDNQIGVITPGHNGMAFGDRGANNSIYTSKFYPLYSTSSRTVAAGSEVDRRRMVYYSGISAAQTANMASQALSLTDSLPAGWNGLIATDPDGTRYLFVANFTGESETQMRPLSLDEGAPVFSVPTEVENGKSTARFTLSTSHSVGDVLRLFITRGSITACQATDSVSAYLTNNAAAAATVGVKILMAGGAVTGDVTVPATSRVRVYVKDGALAVEDAPLPVEPTRDVTALFLRNSSFDEAPVTYDAAGTLNSLAVNLWAGMGYSSAFAYNLPYWSNRCTVTSNSTFAATYAYGSSQPFNGASVPTSAPDGTTAGACLALSSGWGASNAVCFTQSVSLPAGKYRLAYRVCNGNPSAATLIANSFGFVDGEGQGTYDTNLYFAPLSWCDSYAQVQFTSPFEGAVSVGGSCSSAGSAKGPKLFVDGVSLLTDQAIDSVEAYAHDRAVLVARAALLQYPSVTSGAAYDTLCSLLSAHYGSYSECVALVWGLRDAAAAFLDAAATGVSFPLSGQSKKVNVYDMQGRLLLRSATPDEAVKKLDKGLYLMGSRKRFVP